jgi:site-specific DNA-methyltransferase (adenine-specific)
MLKLLNKIHLGDCIEIMKNIPDNSIAGCITDPPYNYEFFGHKWDNSEIERRKVNALNNKSTLVKHIPYGSGLAGGVRNENWYKKNRKNILEYQNWVEQWGKELYRIMKPGGYAFIFNSSRTVAHIQVAMENEGFYARDIFVWIRNSGIPKGLNASLKLEKMGDPNYKDWEQWHSAPRTNWEAISVVQKPLQNNYIETLQNYNVGLLKTKNDIDDSFLSNIFENYKRDKKDDFNKHITVKPLSLIKKLIEISIPPYQDNIVIDPFMGSGTTAIAAKELGINYIGCEISNEYLDIAEQRLRSID